MPLVDSFIPAPRRTSQPMSPLRPARPLPNLVNNVSHYAKTHEAPIAQPKPHQPLTRPAGSGAHLGGRLVVQRPAATHHFATPKPVGPAAPTPPHTAPPRPQPRPAAAPRPQAPQAQAAPAKAVKPHRLLNKLQLPLMMAGIILLGILFQSLVIGEISIVVYAVFALVRRVPSRITFSLAAISVVTVLAVLRVRGNSPLSDNFAVYAFILLAAGVVSLVRETRAQSKVED